MTRLPSNKLQKQQQDPEFSLQYIPNQIEGQCILLSIIPIKINVCKYALTAFLSIITLGIVPLFLFWYPNLKRKMEYNITDVKSATHLCIENSDNQIVIAKKLKDTFFQGQYGTEKLFFINRYLKYWISQNQVRAAKYQEIQQKLEELMSHNASGWTNDESISLIKKFGSGVMILHKPTAFEIFINQILSPVYILMFFNLVIFILNNQYFQIIVLVILIPIGVIMTIIQVIQVNDKQFQMAYYQTRLNVMREGSIMDVSSHDIVPGDIVFFKKAIRIPFETILLEGEMLVNECALTGQSVPIVKKSQAIEKYQKKQPLSKSCYLYDGTTIIQVNNKRPMKIWEKYRQIYGVPVCVTRTNFTTLKGRLMRKILYPLKVQNKFQRQSMKFVLFLIVITIIVLLMLFLKLSPICTLQFLCVKGLDLISITIPVVLPISMIIGVIHAVNKLKHKNIFTISPNQIIGGGQLEIMCFDKTGTLTHDHMNFKSFVPAEGKYFKDIIQVSTFRHRKGAISEKCLGNMASNHSVVEIDQTSQLVGDPMQIQLLAFTDCKIVHHQLNQQALFGFIGPQAKGNVFKRFDFQFSLQRMSVVATLSNGDLYIFTKGSPQKMFQIMRKDSIPDNYLEVLRKYASSGFRVLAIANKKISQWRNIERKDIEFNLEFDGFQIFQNGLKDETKSAIKQLRQNCINPIMITGDNALTASNIGYQSAILDLNTITLIVDYNAQKGFFEELFSYSYIGNYEKYNFKREPVKRKINNSLEGFQSQIVAYSDSLIRMAEKENYNICLTGMAFNILFGEINDEQILTDLQREILQNTQIFARTKPSDKAKIVKFYQKLGKIVGMCGDGANDCDALHQANLGLSLSDTQASIAAAFNSKDRHIGSMIQLIKECRAGLATNISLFNFIVSYALTQLTSQFLLRYFYYSELSDLQGAFQDNYSLIVILFMGNIETSKKLTKQRPSTQLFSFGNIIQLLSYFILQLSSQILIILAISGPFADDIDYFSKGGVQVNRLRFIQNEEAQFLTDSPESNSLFLIANFCYLGIVLAFTITKPWKQQIYTSVSYSVTLVLFFALSISLILVPPLRQNIFELVNMTSMNLNYFILSIGLGVGCLIVIVVRCLTQRVFLSQSQNDEIAVNQ